MPNEIKGCIEKFAPIGLGVGILLLLIVFRSNIESYISVNKLSINSLYGAVFDWASIQTGFLFGIFGFIGTKGDGFIGDVRHSRPMRLFVSYTRRAILIGFLLTISSMPLIVLDKGAQDLVGPWYYVVSVWLSMFVWAFCAFARTAYIFGILISVPEKKNIPG